MEEGKDGRDAFQSSILSIPKSRVEIKKAVWEGLLSDGFLSGWEKTI
jgi:hypothetical protein